MILEQIYTKNNFMYVCLKTWKFYLKINKIGYLHCTNTNYIF